MSLSLGEFNQDIKNYEDKVAEPTHLELYPEDNGALILDNIKNDNNNSKNNNTDIEALDNSR